MFFSISTFYFENAVDAQAQAQRVWEKCEHLVENAANKQLWKACITLLSTVYSGKVAGKTLVKQSNDFAESENAILRYIAAIAATLQPDLSLREAFHIHVIVLRSLAPLFRHLPGIYRRCIVPFFLSYWRAAFEKQRLLFSSVRLVEEGLKQAQSLPNEQQIRSVLKAIALGLEIDSRIVQGF